MGVGKIVNYAVNPAGAAAGDALRTTGNVLKRPARYVIGLGVLAAGGCVALGALSSQNTITNEVTVEAPEEATIISYDATFEEVCQTSAEVQIGSANKDGVRQGGSIAETRPNMQILGKNVPGVDRLFRSEMFTGVVEASICHSPATLPVDLVFDSEMQQATVDVASEDLYVRTDVVADHSKFPRRWKADGDVLSLKFNSDFKTLLRGFNLDSTKYGAIMSEGEDSAEAYLQTLSEMEAEATGAKCLADLTAKSDEAALAFTGLLTESVRGKLNNDDSIEAKFAYGDVKVTVDGADPLEDSSVFASIAPQENLRAAIDGVQGKTMGSSTKGPLTTEQKLNIESVKDVDCEWSPEVKEYLRSLPAVEPSDGPTATTNTRGDDVKGEQ